jgi:hypothetical protein
MAQAFGVTSGGTPTVVVYDESGDQTPNNYDPATPLSTSTSTLSVAVTSGSANGVALATYGVDTSNNNTGAGLAGEINEYVYTYTAPTPKSLLNGPQGAPNAEGPDAAGVITNNFDFTNKSSAVLAGQIPGSTIDPDNVGFFNTVQNTGTSTSNIALLPELLPTGNLPTGTKVRIHTTAGQSATYVVTSTGLAFVAGSGVGNSGGVAISATNPVLLENVASNATASYQVEVDLPTGTTLSTDTSKGFPVVINAFIGGTVAVTGAGDVAVTAPTANNKTIDRVYTGFVKLVKETRILQGSGPVVAPADVAFSSANKNPAAGNIIEYKITYTNISEAQVGAGNAILKANNLAIVEDGTSTNTWAKDGDNNGTIDTSNVVSSAVNLGTTSTIELYKGANGLTSTIDQSGATANDDVTKYIDKVTTVVDPGTGGSFSFQRKLN